MKWWRDAKLGLFIHYGLYSVLGRGEWAKFNEKILDEEYEKLLFGTDWPLVPIEPYVKFVKALVPEEYHEDVFFKNALKVYPRLKELVI